MSDTPQKLTKKAGRTLLVKPTSQTHDYSFLSGLTGLSNSHLTENTGSYFLTFSSTEESLAAYHDLRNNHGDFLKVKFAHYRVFFTMQGLTAESDYTTVKENHINMISNQVGGNVLYYKLYRRNNNYLDCGDLTLDTKEAFDKLVSSSSEQKNFSLSDTLSGVHYRYNKKSGKNTTSTSQNATI